MQSASPATLKPDPTIRAHIFARDTYFKAVDPDTGLGLRLTPGRLPRLDRLDVCTWFHTRHEAEQFIASRIGASTLEIIRFDR